MAHWRHTHIGVYGIWLAHCHGQVDHAIMAAMYGPSILIRALSAPTVADGFGNRWQYHSRSDHHSKIACWGILFDLLLASPLIQTHAAKRRIGFGINHRMSDFEMNRGKDLDLVICTPSAGGPPPSTTRSFLDLAAQYHIELMPRETRDLEGLPALFEAPVGSVQVALEAKACMTAHIKALPRLYDELNSSHLAIHGAVDGAVAAGFVMINLSDTFISTDKNKKPLVEQAAVLSIHKQPSDTLRTIDKVAQIPRRTKPGDRGFDALGIVVVSCRNDGSPIELITKSPPAPTPGDIFHYEAMIQRIKAIYEERFRYL